MFYIPSNLHLISYPHCLSLLFVLRDASCLCCLFETLLCMLFVLRSGLSKRVYKSCFLVNCCLRMPPLWVPQRTVYIYPTNCNTYYTYLSNSTVSTGFDEQGVAVSKLFKTLGPPCHCRALLKDALVHDEGACNQLVFSFNICWMSNCWIRSAVTWLLISLLKLAASSNFNSSLGSKLVNVVAATAAAQNCVADAHNLARYHTCCHTSSSFALALSICECLSWSWSGSSFRHLFPLPRFTSSLLRCLSANIARANVRV